MHRLLILRPDNIGDVLLFSGALGPLRRRWPAHEITLAVRSHVINLVEPCPFVDRVVAYEELIAGPASDDGRDGGPIDLSYWRDGIVVLPVRSPTPAMHADVRRTRAGDKYGIAGDWSNQTEQEDAEAALIYTRRFVVPARQRWRHELAVTGDFLRFLGCDFGTNDELRAEVWISQQDAAFADRQLRHTKTDLTLGLMPEANHPYRVWPVENYARVVRALREVGRVVIFGGGQSPRDVARLDGALSEQCGGVEVVTLSGRTTLRQTLACLDRCDLVISTETWVLHGAVALDVPAVGIMGGGHFGRFYPWGDPRRHRTAHKQLECYHCNWQCPYATVRCIEQIRLEDVVREAEAALGAVGRERRRRCSRVPSIERGAARRAEGGVAVLDSVPACRGSHLLVRAACQREPNRPPSPAALAGQFRKQYVRELWRRLGVCGEPIAVFGAGAHTFWMLQCVWDVRGPDVACILDDAAEPGQTLLDHQVVRPVEGEPPCRCILVSSDGHEERLARRCRELYGEAVEVVRLYEGLPPGPYPKC